MATIGIKKAKYINSINDGVKLTLTNGSIFTIPTFSNIYLHTGLFNSWIALGGVVEAFTTDEELLGKAKKDAQNRITDGFENSFKTGKFISVTAGIEIDNRRYGYDNDIANLSGQIDKGMYPFPWVGVSSSIQVQDEVTAVAIRLEMIQDGEERYFNKWAKEQAIDIAFSLENDMVNPTTVADYDAIVWK